MARRPNHRLVPARPAAGGRALDAHHLRRAAGGAAVGAAVLAPDRRTPPADAGALNIVAKGTHWALYALLVSMVLAGMFLTWTRGDSIFNVFTIPAYDPGNHVLPDQVQEIHGTIGWIILALAGVHASAALVHRYLWHDGVLARMLPRGGRV